MTEMVSLVSCKEYLPVLLFSTFCWWILFPEYESEKTTYLSKTDVVNERETLSIWKWWLLTEKYYWIIHFEEQDAFISFA